MVLQFNALPSPVAITANPRGMNATLLFSAEFVVVLYIHPEMLSRRDAVTQSLCLRPFNSAFPCL